MSPVVYRMRIVFPMLYNLILVLIWLGCACLAGERVWTSSQGVTIKGELVRAGEKEIELRLEDRTIVTIQRSILSAEDWRYIEQWLAEKGTDGGARDETGSHGASGTAVSKQSWPTRIIVPPTLIHTTQDGPELFVYQTDHFIIESTVRLLPGELRTLGRELETCATVLASLPLNLNLALNPRRQYIVKVLLDRDEFIRQGGESRAAFKAMPVYILALLERGGKERKSCGKFNGMHEITHWMTQYAGPHFWINEGLARYLELSVRRGDSVYLDNDLNKVALAVPRLYRRGWAPLPPLKTVFNYHREQPTPALDAAVLLVSTYFFKLDGDRDASRIRRYIDEIKSGNKDMEQLEHILLDGRTYDELERDILHAWRKYMTPVFDK